MKLSVEYIGKIRNEETEYTAIQNWSTISDSAKIIYNDILVFSDNICDLTKNKVKLKQNNLYSICLQQVRANPTFLYIAKKVN